MLSKEEIYARVNAEFLIMRKSTLTKLLNLGHTKESISKELFERQTQSFTSKKWLLSFESQRTFSEKIKIRLFTGNVPISFQKYRHQKKSDDIDQIIKAWNKFVFMPLFSKSTIGIKNDYRRINK